MKKEIASFKVDIIVVLIAYVVIVLTNMQMFTSNEIGGIMYGIGIIFIFGVTLYNLILIDKNLEKSLKVGLVNGLVIVFYFVIESFLPGPAIISNFRIVGWIFLINGIMIFRRANKLLKWINDPRKNIALNAKNSNHRGGYRMNNDANISNYNDTYGKNVEGYSDNSQSSISDGIVVNGYIKDVVFDATSQVYYLEIEYNFEGDTYVFYYRGFNVDITPILDQKDLRKINVYLPGNSPEFAQIDEELLLYRINN